MKFFNDRTVRFLNFCKDQSGVDVNYYLKNGVWMFSERGFLMAKGFILSLLLANFVDKEIFGQYNYILSLMGMLASLALPGMSVAITQAIARGFEGTFIKAIKLTFRWGILGSLALLAISLFYLYKHNNSWIILLLLAPAFPFYGSMNLWKAYYFGKEKFSFVVKKTLWVELFLFAGISGAIFLSSKLIPLVLAAVFIPLFFYWRYNKQIVKEVKNSPADDLNITYGRNISIVYAIAIVGNYLDMVFVGHFVGYAELAGYSIAVLIPEQIKSGMRVLGGLTLPRFSKIDSSKESQKKIIKNILYLLALVGCIILLYLILSPLAFHWFFPKYTNFVSISQIVSIASIVTPFLILDSFFKGQKNQKILITSTVISSLVSIVLMIILVPAFGIWGAVIARISNTILFSLALLFAFLKNYNKLLPPKG